MAEHLFTYGTLSPGESNEHILQDVEGSWESASVVGALHFDGWGSAMGYPGIVLDVGGEQVQGHLFSSDALAGQWELLDEFEGAGYRRELTTVRRSDDSDVQAYIYVLSKLSVDRS